MAKFKALCAVTIDVEVEFELDDADADDDGDINAEACSAAEDAVWGADGDVAEVDMISWERTDKVSE